jgi:hypothetical protein
MTRRRLQRLTMEWTVALTSRNIPADLRRVPPNVDGGLGDLRFRALLAEDDWYLLPSTVRRRFSKRLAGGRTMIYVGEVLETRISRIGWLLAQVARLFGGPLPTSRDANMPSVVTVTEDMATGGQIWTRLYARHNGFPQIIHSRGASAVRPDSRNISAAGRASRCVSASATARSCSAATVIFFRFSGGVGGSRIGSHRARWP